MKKLVLLLIAVLCVGCLSNPYSAFAAQKQNSGANGITLEQAIEKAKSYVTVKAEMKDFESSYDESDSSRVWRLKWSYQQGAYVTAAIDAKNGELIDYSSYDPNDTSSNPPSKIPAISKEQAKIKAQEFIKKVSPSKASFIKLKEQKNSQPDLGQPYGLNYVMSVGGVDFPQNRIAVAVNQNDAAIMNYSVVWNADGFAVQKPVLAPEKARETFESKDAFRLTYFRPYNYLTNKRGAIGLYYDGNARASNAYVDAITGEYFLDSGVMISADKAEAKMLNNNVGSGLTPLEVAEASQVQGLITKEAAVKSVEKTIVLKPGMLLKNAQLMKDFEIPEMRIWSLNWDAQPQNTTDYAAAEIDAKTGDLVSFYIAGPEYNILADKPVVKNKADAQKVATEYIKQRFASYYSEYVVEEPLWNSEPRQESAQASYYFNYIRMKNGAAYPGNYIQVQVDSATGKITSLRTRHENVDFPAVKSAISETALYDQLLKDNPLQLTYLRDTKSSKIRLVYSMPDFDSYLINAVTGQFVGPDGKPIKKVENEINDIKGIKAESDIRQLQQLNVIRIVDGKYQPNDKLRQADAIMLAVKLNQPYIDEATDKWYANYYREAVRMKLISEKEANPERIISRQELAKILVKTDMPGGYLDLPIYSLSPAIKDGKSVGSGYKSSVSLMYASGVMPAQGANWNASGNVTKADFAIMAMRYIRFTEK